MAESHEPILKILLFRNQNRQKHSRQKTHKRIDPTYDAFHEESQGRMGENCRQRGREQEGSSEMEKDTTTKGLNEANRDFAEQKTHVLLLPFSLLVYSPELCLPPPCTATHMRLHAGAFRE